MREYDTDRELFCFWASDLELFYALAYANGASDTRTTKGTTMTTKDEALLLALEALEGVMTKLVIGASIGKENAAIAAIREALAQPEQERNFCARCGKRLGGEVHIHTCTPPLIGEQP